MTKPNEENMNKWVPNGIWTKAHHDKEAQPVLQQAAPVPPVKQEVAERTYDARSNASKVRFYMERCHKLEHQRDQLLAALRTLLYAGRDGVVLPRDSAHQNARAAIAAVDSSAVASAKAEGRAE